MRPGDTEYAIVVVKNATTGAGITGLTSGSFTVSYYLDATTPASSFGVTELGSGFYRFALALPATAGYFNCFITSGSYEIENGRWHGEIENYDVDSIYAVSIKPIATLSSTAALATEITISLNAYRYKSLSVSVVDQAGAAVSLSGYNNWKFSVWDNKHATTISVQNSGITGSAGGIVAWAVPETATFFTNIDAAIAAGDNSVVLYYDMIADEAATASKTSTIFRGQLILTRFEGAA